MTEDGSRHVVHVSDPVMRHLEDLQLDLGQGPSVDAFAGRAPVLEPDLAGAGSRRWPAFAVAAGAGAIFALTLQTGAIRVGTLDLYREGAGMLTPDQLADALVLADLLTEVVLDVQADVPAGSVSGRLIDAHGLSAASVHQATGMVARLTPCPCACGSTPSVP